MLNQEGQALEWHCYSAQRHGGLRQLTWEVYVQALQEIFGSQKDLDPMIELVALK